MHRTPTLPKTAAILVCALLAATVASFTAPEQEQEKPWEEILGPTQAAIPDPLPDVIWRPELYPAIELAQSENRPLFVTLRCIPCKQCADFDKEVLEGGPLLSPLLRQFVTVRLTDASDLDLRRFPVEGFQDFDLSWWGWFLSPEGRVYGVFGGRDHVSDATRMSGEALANTLRRVLEHHYDPRRSRWDIDGPAPDLSRDRTTPMQLPGYTAWRQQAEGPRDCIHCHQVAEILRQPIIDAGNFDKTVDFEVWPLPENTGLVLDRDHGLRVVSVEPGSPADNAGLRTGDVLAASTGRRFYGQADFRGILHRAPRTDTTVPILWLRDGELHSGTLELREGWKRTILDWRASVSGGNVGGHPSFWPLAGNPNARRRLGLDEGTMAVEPYFGPNPSGPAFEAGLRWNDIITAVDGESPDLSARSFLVWFRMDHEPGDSVQLTVRNPRGTERLITYRLPQR